MHSRLKCQSRSVGIPDLLVVVQAGRLVGYQGFPKGLVAIMRGHKSAELTLEVAWLLALISAGPEAHMYAMVKHGAAEAVASALVSASDSQVRVHDCAKLFLCNMPAHFWELWEHLHKPSPGLGCGFVCCLLLQTPNMLPVLP